MIETTKKEKALLVVVDNKKGKWPIQDLVQEFKNLVFSTGIEVEEDVLVKINKPTPALYIGKGKAEELALFVKAENIDVVIFNNELNFTQQRNLEDYFGKKTIDRTQLILDIFANRAQSREGILQVELAQLQYLLPRLRGKGIALSRLGGGIGTRGPGEKKLEIDRRRISEKIIRLKRDLKDVRQHREVMRKKRQKKNLSVCSLLGYTNAGKSTLFNALSDAREKTSSALFTTLDTVSRAVNLHNNMKVVFTDTVGFIYDLPHNLIESFKATLEELHYADLLLHVIDASSPDIKRLREAVDSIMKELDLSDRPVVLVFNKIDKVTPDDLCDLKILYPEAVFVSALKKTNFEELKEMVYEEIFKDLKEVILKFPFKLMEVVDYIHKNLEVLKTNYQEDYVVYWVRAKPQKLAYLEQKGVKIKEI